MQPQQKDLIVKKIGYIHLTLYAHSEWIEKNKPQMNNLDTLPFVGLYEYATSQLERDYIASLGFASKYQFRSAAWSSVYASIKAQIGMGVLPTFIGDTDKDLQKIFPQQVVKTPLWLVVHPDMYTNAKIKKIIQYLSELF